MSRSLILTTVGIITALVLVGFLFTMNEREQGLVLQFGEPKRVIQTSGLHYKIPLIQNVVRYDKRILEYNLPVEEVIAVDKKRMLVDSFARFKIIDPLEFYKTVGNETNVRNRLNSNVISSLRRVVGRVTLDELLSAERSNIMERIKIEVNEEAKRFGIEVVDVRIRRADLPEATSATSPNLFHSHPLGNSFSIAIIFDTDSPANHRMLLSIVSFLQIRLKLLLLFPNCSI